MKKIVILGSTGSIGRNALSVISQYPDKFRVIGLTAGNNSRLLAEQIEKFHPEAVAVSDEKAWGELKEYMSGRTSPEIFRGVEGICGVAAMDGADIVLSSIIGSAGLLPTMAAVRKGAAVALANKETIVMAGDIVLREAKQSGATLLPVDSEHSAVFQCMAGYKKESIERIILTASGGPFIGKKREELELVTAEHALRHPNWSMGRKISIDSATLMNKGLEVIEARFLFDIPPEKIEVLVHPQSIVHSMIEFVDGSCLAQLSQPDMRAPIAYALSWPDRLENIIPRMEWDKISGLTFRKPDTETFPCLSYAYDALRAGGSTPVVLNAANEVAVGAFLNGLIGFNKIPAIIREVMDRQASGGLESIEAVLEADGLARREALKIIAAERK